MTAAKSDGSRQHIDMIDNQLTQYDDTWDTHTDTPGVHASPNTAYDTCTSNTSPSRAHIYIYTHGTNKDPSSMDRF